MKTLLLPVATLAMIMLPAAANAAQCRNTDTGKFAKCGAPGSVPASQYVAKTKSTAKSRTADGGPGRAGFMAMIRPKAKPVAVQPVAGTKSTKMTKMARCKDAKSKFVKCGTPGSKPA